MTTDSEGTREVSPSGKAAIEEARVALWEDCGHVPLGDPIRSVKAAVFCDACGPQILESLVHKVTEDAAVEARRLREQRTAAEDERDEQYRRHIRRIGDLESRLRETERDWQAFSAYEYIVRAEAAEASARGLAEALMNMRGAFDTPVERRRRPFNEFQEEAVKSMRAALSEWEAAEER